MAFSLGIVTVISISSSVVYLEEKALHESIGYMSRRSFPVFFTCLVLALCYILQLLGRVTTSENSLNCLKSYDTNLDDIAYDPETEAPIQIYYPPVFYPFQVSSDYSAIDNIRSLILIRSLYEIIQPGYINLTSEHIIVRSNSQLYFTYLYM